MNTPFPINTPLGLGDLLDLAFWLYRGRLGKLLLTAAVFLAPLAVLSAFLTNTTTVSLFAIFQQIAEAGGDAPFTNQPFPSTPTVSPWAILLVPCSLLLMGGVALAVTAQTFELLHGDEAPLSTALRAALHYFWTWIGMNIVRGLAVFSLLMALSLVIGLFFVFVMAVVGLSAAFAAPTSEAAGGVMAVLVIIIVVIMYLGLLVVMAGPSLYLWARWSLAIPCMIVEKLGPIEALRRSWRLTQGNVRRSIGYLLLLSILSVILVSIPANIIQFLLFSIIPIEQFYITLALSAALGTVVTLIWQPFSVVANVLLYYELRVRNESYDLEVQVSELEKDN